MYQILNVTVPIRSVSYDRYYIILYYIILYYIILYYIILYYIILYYIILYYCILLFKIWNTCVYSSVTLHMNQTHKKEGKKHDEGGRKVFREVQIKAN